MTPEKAAEHRAVLLSGEEDALRTEFLHKLLDAALGDGDPCDRESVDADTRPPADWFGAASMVPFLSDRRIVVVRHLARLAPDSLGKEFPKRLKAMAEGLPECALLVLCLDTEAGSDERQQRLQRYSEKWVRLAKSAGIAAVEFKADANASKREVSQRAGHMGLKIGNAAATMLVEMCGGRAGLAVGELEKVAMFVGERKEIMESDVAQVVAPEFDYSVYRLIDATLSGNRRESLAQLRSLARTHERPEAQIFSRVFPIAARELRLLWQARLCLEAGTGWRQPPDSVTRSFPTRDRLDKSREWQANRAMRTARNVSLPQIRFALRTLTRVDQELKGMRPAANSYESLERGVLAIATRLASS